MARRLTADAKIVLERAGYTVLLHAAHIEIWQDVDTPARLHVGNIPVDGGTVDNDKVIEVLNIRGFDEYCIANDTRRYEP